MERKDYPIVFIYNNDKYLRYTIQNIEKPKFVSTGIAHRLGKFLYFLELGVEENSQTIADYIEVKAMISNKNDLIFFGDKQFCSANVSVPAPPVIHLFERLFNLMHLSLNSVSKTLKKMLPIFLVVLEVHIRRQQQLLQQLLLLLPQLPQ